MSYVEWHHARFYDPHPVAPDDVTIAATPSFGMWADCRTCGETLLAVMPALLRAVCTSVADGRTVA